MPGADVSLLHDTSPSRVSFGRFRKSGSLTSSQRHKSSVVKFVKWMTSVYHLVSLAGSFRRTSQLSQIAGSSSEGGHGEGVSGGHGYDTPNAGKIWLVICSIGIMASFIIYGVVMEYATSGGRKLHELSLIFVTSLLYTVTAWVGRHIRGEVPTTIPKHQMVVLGFTSMGSTFTSVRSLRYVIYPVQVLAKSCKPIPVMLMGAAMGKKYPLKKYVNVIMIVCGVAMFMGGGKGAGKSGADAGGQVLGLLLLFMSLCFDGGTGAYEDKLMCKHHVGPFDLMFNIQFAKMLLAGLGLIIFGQINYFFSMVQETGFVLLLLGMTGALGQVFIFVTISKFGALTCSIIGLARKILTLVASIVIYGHAVNLLQGTGLALAVAAMVINFTDKGGKKKGNSGGAQADTAASDAQQRQWSEQEVTDSSSAVELKSLLAHEDEEDDPDAAEAGRISAAAAAEAALQASRKPSITI
ncbi:UAA transporter family-domain-containing protein [Tribonema minus]|uniref:UAA transporter family-domain-containing protein n=1 Tax=Tribonema minus TaxID=303371 RepID=A0A835YUC6_9STRA|nr:UAA transporter family-domain-containing protein [Tribonema minus]